MKLFIFAAALAMSGAALAQSTVAPDNSAPERDARGIPVISAPAVAPPGVNEPVVVPPGTRTVPNENQAAAFATQPAPDPNPPACSKTITDHCVQAYEGRHR